MLGLSLPRQYPRGANPYGGDFASAGANFKAGIQGGYQGTVMGPVAAGAIRKFYAPIGESHCIAAYQGGLKEGPSINLAGWINEVFHWALKYNVQSFPGMPINDNIVPLTRTVIKNGVYEVQDAEGIAPVAGASMISRAPLKLK